MTISVNARWALCLTFNVAVAALASCGTGVWMLARLHGEVALTQGLRGKTWQAASDEFDRRIKQSFPIGSPVSEMGAVLRRQGFCRIDWGSSPGLEHDAMRREDSFVCNQAAYVIWRDDEAGRVIAVRGTYREEGCL